jgi:hypothetical protein
MHKIVDSTRNFLSEGLVYPTKYLFCDSDKPNQIQRSGRSTTTQARQRTRSGRSPTSPACWCSRCFPATRGFAWRSSSSRGTTRLRAYESRPSRWRCRPNNSHGHRQEFIRSFAWPPPEEIVTTCRRFHVLEEAMRRECGHLDKFGFMYFGGEKRSSCCYREGIVSIKGYVDSFFEVVLSIHLL